MDGYTDSLRGYGYDINKRDGFRCRYCGWDGSKWQNWLYLSVDHLLPKGHPERNNPEYIVTACFFCNVADNQYFKKATERGVNFEGKTQDELVEQRCKYVMDVRNKYQKLWEKRVKPA